MKYCISAEDKGTISFSLMRPILSTPNDHRQQHIRSVLPSSFLFVRLYLSLSPPLSLPVNEFFFLSYLFSCDRCFDHVNKQRKKRSTGSKNQPAAYGAPSLCPLSLFSPSSPFFFQSFLGALPNVMIDKKSSLLLFSYPR